MQASMFLLACVHWKSWDKFCKRNGTPMLRSPHHRSVYIPSACRSWQQGRSSKSIRNGKRENAVLGQGVRTEGTMVSAQLPAKCSLKQTPESATVARSSQSSLKFQMFSDDIADRSFLYERLTYIYIRVMRRLQQYLEAISLL